MEGEGGWFSVTVGDAVSTVKLIVLLAPCGLPSELAWVATAVYWPLESGLVACPEFHSPGAFVASALETSTLNTL